MLLNQGDGTFGPAQGYSAPSDLTHVALLDLDADGDLDAATWGGSELHVFTNSGVGTFTHASSLPAPTFPSEMRVADLSGDGHPDLLVPTDPGEVLVFVSDGAGGLDAAAPIPFGTGAKDADVFDFDGDGRLDVIALSLGQLGVFQNVGAAQFVQHGLYKGAEVNYLVATRLEVDDADGDGDADAIVSHEGIPFSPLQPGGVEVYLNVFDE